MGSLWQRPFDVFDGITCGAFSDHRSSYEATAPVFYRVEWSVDLPDTAGAKREKSEDYGLPPGQKSAFEMKLPTDRWATLHSFDLGFLEQFHHSVDLAWLALLLAAPAATFPRPRLSATFALTPGGEGFRILDRAHDGVRIQGDADLEYCFFPEAASSPLSEHAITRASAWLDSLSTMAKMPALADAVGYLVSATSPSLTPVEQLTLAVMGLEDLLLPDVVSQLSATFSRRVAALLAVDPRHRDELAGVARVLYDARSSALHGEQPRSVEAATSAANGAHAQQLLVAAIQAILATKEPEAPSRDHLKRLDRLEWPANSDVTRLPSSTPDALRPTERMLRAKESMILFMNDQGMHGPHGKILMWVPLIGLANDDTFVIDGERTVLFTPMTVTELISLDERDIRRDFVAQLHDRDLAPIACFALLEPDDEPFDIRMSVLKRRRDLVTVALRICGFHSFHDPEFFGTAVFRKHVRFRRPTVFRQTLMQMFARKTEQRIDEPDSLRVSVPWSLLRKYELSRGHDEIDNVLRVFRRVFDHTFLPIQTRGALMFAALEAMLGRFRGRREPIQLEDYVASVLDVGDPASAWFAAAGRTFRNTVAHGSWEGRADDPALAHLTTILCATLPVFVWAWLERVQEDESLRPATLLIARLHEYLR
jgi:hypothetical protein